MFQYSKKKQVDCVIIFSVNLLLLLIVMRVYMYVLSPVYGYFLFVMEVHVVTMTLCESIDIYGESHMAAPYVID